MNGAVIAIEEAKAKIADALTSPPPLTARPRTERTD